MINVILPVVEEPEKFAEFAKKVAGSDVKVFVGLRRGLNFDLGEKHENKQDKNTNLSEQERIQTENKSNSKTRKLLMFCEAILKGRCFPALFYANGCSCMF